MYSDWSSLLYGVEGAKLHAQLKVMYEHGEYREYLGVVESVLNRYVLYRTVLYCDVTYCTVLWCNVLHCDVLYCTVLYCDVTYCIVM